jgi:hypothetical protein
MTQPNPHAYRRLFEDNPDGAAVLEQLIARFGRNPYTPGGVEAARATDYKAGQLEVVQFILRQINRAHGVNDAAEDPAPIDE